MGKTKKITLGLKTGLYHPENFPQKGYEKKFGSRSDDLPREWQSRDNFGVLGFLGFGQRSDKSLSETLSKESKEVLRMALEFTKNARGVGETYEVGTDALGYALLRAEKGLIVEIVDQELWDVVKFSRWDARLWMDDPLIRRASEPYLSGVRGKLSRSDKDFIERYTGLGG